MTILKRIYRDNLTLVTDIYQLTSAYVYWKSRIHERESVFYMFHRKTPFGGGYSINAGLEYVLDWVQDWRYPEEDLDFIGSIAGNDKKPFFPKEFLNYLKNLRFTGNVDAVPEGSVVFPYEPVVRVNAPLIQGQLFETFCLNQVNFQSLIATKAARTCDSAKGDPVFDFGLRRCQGIDGALTASRAAFVGGISGTSNVKAAQLFGIPLKGTHPHALVMAFDSEMEAFLNYAEALPNNCVFLVDTFSTLSGVRNAIMVCLQLVALGHTPIGIRLDSGDLSYLSIQARELLDFAGLPDVAVVASNDLDEHLIESLKQQGSKISVWGVGTKMMTAYDQPAFGGVYKLAAIKGKSGVWKHKIKLSEQVAKTSNPGMLQTRRYLDTDGSFLGDLMYDEITGIADGPLVMVDPSDSTRRRTMNGEFFDLLQPQIRFGERVPQESLIDIRARRTDHMSKLHSGVRRLVNPHGYPVGLDLGLHTLKNSMILEARGIVEQ